MPRRAAGGPKVPPNFLDLQAPLRGLTGGNLCCGLKRHEWAQGISFSSRQESSGRCRGEEVPSRGLGQDSQSPFVQLRLFVTLQPLTALHASQTPVIAQRFPKARLSHRSHLLLMSDLLLTAADTRGKHVAPATTRCAAVITFTCRGGEKKEKQISESR